MNRVLLVGSFLLACCGVVSANGELKSELADLKAKVASLESARMAPAAGGDAASLTSMKKKGSIQIGGKVDVDVIAVRRDDMGANADANDEVDSTYFGTGLPTDCTGAYLDFKINASADTFLYIKLDIDDMWNQTADQDDLLEEVYFQWNKVRGSNFDLVFGKKGIDYGMDKWAGITPSLHDGSAYWLSGLEDNTGETASNAHNSIGTNDLTSGCSSDIFQIEAVYHYKDLLNVYLTLFQNNETTGGGRTTRGMHEDRSDDTLFFQSYAL
ncbi:MAG: hypothetical protein JXR97_01345, partial [Planctomycetes bacterium]|nr:hypothetical protein [Planctomycetota bacterium]